MTQASVPISATELPRSVDHVPVVEPAPVHISVVVPVYRGAECIDELFRRLVDTLEPINPNFEIVLVEDRGPDDSWARIEGLAREDARVRGLQLSRNFGQHPAISAGLQASRGDWVVVMDCDLQDQPEEIAKLYDKAQQGFDVVLARRAVRKDRWTKKMTSVIFYKTFNYLTDLNYDGSVANFSIVSRTVVNQLCDMNEQVRFYGGFLTWMGFDRAYVDVEHAPRFAGESSYTLTKLFRMAIPIILAYSNKPLRLCISLGLGIAGLAFLGAIGIVIQALFFSSPVMGWASLIVSIYFSTGVIIAVLGVLGLYVDRIFTEAKARPIYIVQRSTFDG
ncbi:MAG: glycosyltransferase family 2 protein [Myxococcota bacterium]